MSMAQKFKTAVGVAALVVGLPSTVMADGLTSQEDCVKAGLCDPHIAHPNELRAMKPYTKRLIGVEANPQPSSLKNFNRECNVIRVGDRYFAIPDIDVNVSSDQCGCTSGVAISEYKLSDSEIVRVFGFEKNWCPKGDGAPQQSIPEVAPLMSGGCAQTSSCGADDGSDNNSDLDHDSGTTGGNDPGGAESNGNDGAGAGSGGNNDDLGFKIPSTTIPVTHSQHVFRIA